MKTDEKFIQYYADGLFDRQGIIKKLNVFDHDLFLFTDGGYSRGDEIRYGDLQIIEYRSAKPAKSHLLADVAELSDEETKFVCEALSDPNKRFVLAIGADKVLLIFNRLYHSAGLGVAAVFDASADLVLSCIKEGLLDHFGDKLCSSQSYSKAKRLARLADEIRSMELTDSIHDVAELLNVAVGEGGGVSFKRENREIVPAIAAIASLSGCGIDVFVSPSDRKGKAESDCLTVWSLMLCLICRRLSAERRGRVYVEEAFESYRIRAEFELSRHAKLESVIPAVEFMEGLAERLEIPFYFELDGERCESELVPKRIDPSLSGLKAGVHIKFNEN